MTRRARQLASAARAGFTYIELLIVLVVLGVLALGAVGRFGSYTTGRRLASAAGRVAADLRLAQRAAYTAGASRAVDFSLGANRYTVESQASLDRAAADYVVDLSAEPYGVQLQSANFGGQARVAFNGYGQPQAGGVVVVALHGSVATVTVDAATGEVRVP
jgi:type II secretion system protein H